MKRGIFLVVCLLIVLFISSCTGDYSKEDNDRTSYPEYFDTVYEDTECQMYMAGFCNVDPDLDLGLERWTIEGELGDYCPICSNDLGSIPEEIPFKYTCSPISITSYSSCAPAASRIFSVAFMISGPIPSP